MLAGPALADPDDARGKHALWRVPVIVCVVWHRCDGCARSAAANAASGDASAANAAGDDTSAANGAATPAPAGSSAAASAAAAGSETSTAASASG